MRHSLLFVSLVLISNAAHLANAANLSEIHALAKANDPIYAAAKEAHRAGLEALPQGKALLRPSINLGGYLRRVDAETSAPSNVDYSTRGYSLTLSQPLYNKSVWEGYEKSKLAVVLTEQQLQVAEQDLLLRVAQAYFNVLLAQDNLSAAEAQKQAVAQQLAQARKTFEVGAATIVDTHEAQARFDLATAQEISAQNDLEVKRRSLEKLIAREAPRLASFNTSAGMPLPLPVPNVMADWVIQAENQSLSVQTSQTAAQLASRDLDLQRGGYRPTVNLTASYGDDRNTNPASVNSRTGTIGLELAWPLYQGGITDSRVREGLAKQEKARYDLENARRQSALDTRQSFLGVVSGDAQVKALEQALVSSESQLKSTKLGLDVGVRTRVDVLNAQQLVYSTQRDLAAARYQTLLASLQLKAAVGALSAEDLKQLDALLMP
jgi:outer membrane protein